MSAVSVADPLEGRILGAMHDCISRWGIAKTTVDDIARAAGISRATLYRVYPGGKDVAFDALLRHEAACFFEAITEPLAEAPTLEDAIVLTMVEAAAFVTGHGPLQYLLANEPERMHQTNAFDGLDRVFAIATGFAAPHIRRFLPTDEIAFAGTEWIVRQFFTYLLVPSPSLDLADEADVRRFTRTYLLPAFTQQEI